MPMTSVSQFCEIHKACGEGTRWAMGNYTNMTDVWNNATPDWKLWIATRESCGNGEPVMPHSVVRPYLLYLLSNLKSDVCGGIHLADATGWLRHAERFLLSQDELPGRPTLTDSEPYNIAVDRIYGYLNNINDPAYHRRNCTKLYEATLGVLGSRLVASTQAYGFDMVTVLGRRKCYDYDDYRCRVVNNYLGQAGGMVETLFGSIAIWLADNCTPNFELVPPEQAATPLAV